MARRLITVPSEAPLTPEQFIAALDGWSASGGSFPEDIPLEHVVATADEAQAVCRALRSAHVQTTDSIGVPALHNLAAYFQSAQSPATAKVLKAWGAPILRDLLTKAFAQPFPALPAKDNDEKGSTYLFVLKVLTLYDEAGDGQLIVKAAREPQLRDEYMWSVVFEALSNGHPDLQLVIDRLRDPLPEGFLGVTYLDLCNEQANKDAAMRHPFATPDGLPRLASYLGERDPQKYSYAASAAVSIPFLESSTRRDLLERANRHPDRHVQLEAAWAGAKVGDTAGRDRLIEFCLDPRYSERAMQYLDELGFDNYAPAAARDPDFVAMAELAGWLAHPMEFGRPPTDIKMLDSRELFWPPTRDRRQLWLFRYRYDDTKDDGIGCVGSVTFALFGEATADLPPEDVYGLHCAWELEMNNDPLAPKKRSALAGRKLLAASNPGFSLAR